MSVNATYEKKGFKKLAPNFNSSGALMLEHKLACELVSLYADIYVIVCIVERLTWSGVTSVLIALIKKKTF